MEIECGGYFLARAVQRPACFSADLMPAEILSLSDCIADLIPGTWTIEGVNPSSRDHESGVVKLRLASGTLASLRSYVTPRLEDGSIGWPNVFFTVADAQEFASRFLVELPEVRLLGAGLHANAVDRFLAEEASEPRQGIYRALSNRADPEPGGMILGWEVLCYVYGTFHSWLCNGLERDVAERLGIRPNAVGFIDNAEEAMQASEYCSRDEVRAEAGFWAPWRVVEYDVPGRRRRDV